jgi:hypothetical protein
MHEAPQHDPLIDMLGGRLPRAPAGRSRRSAPLRRPTSGPGQRRLPDQPCAGVRLLRERQTIEIKLWHEPGDSIPADPEASIGWLFKRWRQLDSWVDERRRAGTDGDPRAPEATLSRLAKDVAQPRARPRVQGAKADFAR